MRTKYILPAGWAAVAAVLLLTASTLAYQYAESEPATNSFRWKPVFDMKLEEPNFGLADETTYTKQVTVTNTGEMKESVRVALVPMLKEKDGDSYRPAPLGDLSGNTIEIETEDGTFKLHLNLANWSYSGGISTYNSLLAPGDSTDLLLTQVTVEPKEGVTAATLWARFELDVLADAVEHSGNWNNIG